MTAGHNETIRDVPAIKDPSGGTGDVGFLTGAGYPR